MKLESVSIKKGRGESLFLLIASCSALLAAAVVSAAPIYFESIEQLGARRQLGEFSASQTGAWVQVREVTVNPTAITATRRSIDEAGDELGDLVREEAIFLRSGRMAVVSIDDDPPPPALEFVYQSVEGIDLDIDLVSGSLPSKDGEVIEVAMLDHVAQGLGIAVGSRLVLTVQPTTIVHSVALVTGTFEISDPTDETWLGLSSSIFDPERGPTGGRPPIIALAHSDSLNQLAQRPIADIGEIWALYYSDAEALTRTSVEDVLESVSKFRLAVTRDLSGAIAFSGLQSAYLTLQRQLSFSNTIALIAGSLFAAFALFNLGIHAFVIASRWSRDETLLMARGADRRQLVHAIVTYALLLFLVPTALGPLIAAAVLPLLGKISAISEITGGALLPVKINAEQFIWSASASVATLIVFISPLLRVHGSELVNRFGGLRMSGSPWIWRANLDVGVMIAAAALIVEMNGRGSLFVVRDDGSTGLSVLAASLPVVASVAASLLSLRMLAAAAPLLERLSRVNLLPMASLGMRLLSRSTLQHAILVLLGTGVIVVTVSALGLAETLEKSSEDRNSFRTAFDVRVTGVDGARGGNNPTVTEVLDNEWVQRHAWGARTKATAGVTETAPPFELLALDPTAFNDGAWFRDDFSDNGLASLMESVADFSQSGTFQIPDSAVGLEAVASLSRSGRGRMDLWARVVDAEGMTHTLRFDAEDDPGSQDWQEWSTSLDDALPKPLRLAAIQIYQPPTSPLGNEAVLTIDSLRAFDSDGSRHTIAEFSDATVWHAMEASLPDNASISATASSSSDTSDGMSLRVEMGKGTANGIRGIFYSENPVSGVPIAVSAGFKSATGLATGDEFTGRAFGQLIPFEIRDEFDLFPTMSERDSAFAVGNIDALLSYMKPISEPFLGNAAELYLTVAPDSSPDQRTSDIKSVDPSLRVMDREGAIQESSTGFAATAGWRVVGIAIAVATLAISSTAAVAFTIHRQGSFRVDHAILESIGASKWSIALESLLRTMISVGAGIALGFSAALPSLRFIADRMTRAETGENVIPPMELAIDWWAIGGFAAAFGLAAVAPIIVGLALKVDTVATRIRSTAS